MTTTIMKNRHSGKTIMSLVQKTSSKGPLAGKSIDEVRQQLEEDTELFLSSNEIDVIENSSVYRPHNLAAPMNGYSRDYT